MTSNQPTSTTEMVSADSLVVGDRVVYGYGPATVVEPAREVRGGRSHAVVLEHQGRPFEVFFPVGVMAERVAQA